MTSPRSLEKNLLQIAVAVAGAVPVAAGVAGALWGPAMINATGDLDLDSHFRYLSGLLAGIGVLYWTTIPRIEVMTRRFGLLTLIVVTGGLCRALGMLITGPSGIWMMLALGMELVITPSLYLWQNRVARQATLAAVAPRPTVVGAPPLQASRKNASS